MDDHIRGCCALSLAHLARMSDSLTQGLVGKVYQIIIIIIIAYMSYLFVFLISYLYFFI